MINEYSNLVAHEGSHSDVLKQGYAYYLDTIIMHSNWLHCICLCVCAVLEHILSDIASSDAMRR